MSDFLICHTPPAFRVNIGELLVNDAHQLWTYCCNSTHRSTTKRLEIVNTPKGLHHDYMTSIYRAPISFPPCQLLTAVKSI